MSADIAGWWYAECVRGVWVIHEGSHVRNGTVFIAVESEAVARQVVEAHNAALLSLASTAYRVAHERRGKEAVYSINASGRRPD